MAETNYFSSGSGDASDEQATWIDWQGSTSIEMVPGLQIQALTSANVMVSFVHLEPHTEAAVHWHDEEQISIVIDGELEFEVGGVTRTLRRGDAVLIPSNVPHGARTGSSPCFELDVFNPPRRALLDALGIDVGAGEPADDR
ncbi:MAG: cupin domain-containing protein [Actinobacteria bacterium]|nr:cupin domain-containing protein [Actinomycetota bacterium]